MLILLDTRLRVDELQAVRKLKNTILLSHFDGKKAENLLFSPTRQRPHKGECNGFSHFEFSLFIFRHPVMVILFTNQWQFQDSSRPLKADCGFFTFHRTPQNSTPTSRSEIA